MNQYLAFDAINSRGLTLSQFDKIKNFCILLESIRSIGSITENAWFEALKQLEKFGVSDRLYEEAFMRELYNVFFKQSHKSELIHKMFTHQYKDLLQQSNSDSEDELKDFIGCWQQYARSFGLICSKSKKDSFKDNPSKENGECTLEAGEWLVKLDNLKMPTITRPILVAAHIRLGNDEFEEVARACEVFTFRLYSVCRRKVTYKFSEIIKLANDILIKRKDKNYIITKLCKWLQEDAPLSKVLNELGNAGPKYEEWKAGLYYFLYEWEIECSPSGTTFSKQYAQKEKDKIKHNGAHLAKKF